MRDSLKRCDDDAKEINFLYCVSDFSAPRFELGTWKPHVPPAGPCLPPLLRVHHSDLTICAREESSLT